MDSNVTNGLVEFSEEDRLYIDRVNILNLNNYKEAEQEI